MPSRYFATKTTVVVMEALTSEKVLHSSTINGREFKLVQVLSFGARTWDVREDGEHPRVYAEYEEAVQIYMILVARCIMGIDR